MTDINVTKRANRIRRHARVRAKISGTAERPRVAVFKSNTHLYAQAIDDTTSKTIAAVNAAQAAKKGTKTERAKVVGTKLAELLTKAGIKVAVFDVSGFKYHGRVKAVAEGLREGGITV
jgi:large subunit ribosomal protein L18